MAKKRRQSEIVEQETPMQDIEEIANEPSALSSLATTLEYIRSQATARRYQSAQTISELEGLRAEIDAAIAFLKAGQ
jgi:hypothetical protein